MAMAIANVVRRLYRLNTDIIPSFFSMSRGFPSLYIYSAVSLAPFVLGFSPIFRAFSEAGGAKKSSTGTKTLPSSRSSSQRH